MDWKAGAAALAAALQSREGALRFLDGPGRPLLFLLALAVVGLCAWKLFSFRQEPEIWAWLTLPTGDRLPVTHWENSIGRGRRCDLTVEYPTVSRMHGVLTRYDDGSWTVRDAGSKTGIQVNGKPVILAAVGFGDVITMGGVDFTLLPVEAEGSPAREAAAQLRQPGPGNGGILGLLTLFQLLLAVCLLGHLPAEQAGAVLTGFAGLAVAQWCLLGVERLLHRTGFEMETLAFFLTTLGFSAVASAHPEELVKQLAALWLGMALFLAVGWSLRNVQRAKKIRYGAAAAGLLLLAANLLFGTEIHGAKNWIYFGPVSLQPSELVKICFVFAGTSTLERVVAKRNLTLFLVYSGVICLCLAAMNDFGTALVFFTAFLVISYLRSGNFATLALICGGTAFAGILALRFRPYIRKRFAAWGHVWQYSLTSGYQQTRAMMCIAAGGLFGAGAGSGWLKHVAAADTDLVFALLSEELGLLTAGLAVAALICLCAFVVRAAPMGRSSFYTIGACAAASILVMQAICNVFGTVDFLPLTGVTFPFVSNGGSSILSAWGLLAFLKAGDTRQNASFAVKGFSKEGPYNEKNCGQDPGAGSPFGDLPAGTAGFLGKILAEKRGMVRVSGQPLWGVRRQGSQPGEVTAFGHVQWPEVR